MKQFNQKILDNIFDIIGKRPLVRLNSIPKAEDVKCEIVVKCEFLNPSGSVHDRIALKMIKDAEERNEIKPGDLLIEPTAGDMSIAVALVSSFKGYRCQFVTSEEMDIEKENILRVIGAKIVRAPSFEYCRPLEANLDKAHCLKKKRPDAHILDVYDIKRNALTDYDGIAEEILSACGERLDMVVAGAHTVATLVGLARNIKRKFPKCLVVGVYSKNKDGPINSGVKNKRWDFLPKVRYRRDIDNWYKFTEKESFAMARRLNLEEDMLCGGCSGSAVLAAIAAAKDYDLPATARVVVLLPDSLNNNMTNILSDEWLDDGNFLDRLMLNQSNDRQNEILRQGTKVLHKNKRATIVDVIQSSREKLLYVLRLETIPPRNIIASPDEVVHNELISPRTGRHHHKS